jgi:hypothetical protein
MLQVAPIKDLYEVAVRIGNSSITAGVVSVEFESHNYICEVSRSEMAEEGFAMRVIAYAPDVKVGA